MREDIGADKGAEFADSRRNAVVLATDARGARLGSEQADVVAGADFAEGLEDAVDDGKRGDDVRLGETGVAAGHNEAHNGLKGDTRGERVARADEVGEGSTQHGSGDVEEVDDSVPAEDGGQGSISGIEDVGQDGRGVDREGIGRELENVSQDKSRNAVEQKKSHTS